VEIHVEFKDEETNEISGTIGQADTREECEGFLEFDMQYHDSHGRIVLNAEAAEVCIIDHKNPCPSRDRHPVHTGDCL